VSTTDAPVGPVDDDVDWEEIRELITDAYRLAAPKTLAKRID
jgi:predicted DNA-binding protein (MmcQ/YjbR family)